MGLSFYQLNHPDSSKPTSRIMKTLQVYTEKKIFKGISRTMKRKIDEMRGICVGISLNWLQQEEHEGTDSNSAIQYAEKSCMIQCRADIYYDLFRFPETLDFSIEQKDFKDIRKALAYMWLISGSYLVLTGINEEPEGHTIAFHKDADDNMGYLLNSNTGNHCC